MSDPSVCPDCKGPMKPLFTGWYCPKDCDKPHLKAARLDAEIKKAQDIMAAPRISYTPKNGSSWNPHGFIFPSYGGPPSYRPADDQCRKQACQARGTVTHSSVIAGLNFAHYKCTLCNDTWAISLPSTSQAPAYVN